MGGRAAITAGMIIIDGKQVETPPLEIDIKLGQEVHQGDMMQNADGEIFYKTVKIAHIRKAGLFKRILVRMKGVR